MKVYCGDYIACQTSLTPFRKTNVVAQLLYAHVDTLKLLLYSIF